jgi:hypothetical protein
VCVLWVRSFWAADSLVILRGLSDPPKQIDFLGLTSGSGIIGVFRDCTDLPELSEAESALFRRHADRVRLQNGIRWSTKSKSPPDFPNNAPSALKWLGFVASREEEKVSALWTKKALKSKREFVGIPLWFAAILTALLPLALSKPRIVKRWAQWRNPGCCPSCGYDLRATPDRCPECGRAAKLGAA